eukprot:GFKZ01006825.1.p1 GENE.GFKZ01006825.1~~GFKZ01006825.1.p1  ORF type:complete len:432 (+),score=48.75 GFKZ01006825.1:177-1472(+)
MTFTTSKSLSSYKLWYLFFYAAQYTQLFVPLMLSRTFHYPAHQIGLLMSLRRLLIFLGAPLFTRLLDHTRLHRPLLLLTHTLYYICSLILTRIRALPLVTLTLCLRELFVSGCEPAIDNATVAKLTQLDRPTADYGRLRLYGSLGWGVASILGSMLVDYVFSGDLIVVLYIQAVIGLAVIVLVAAFMDLSPALFEFQQHAKEENGTMSHLRDVIRTPRALFCAVAVTMQGIVLGTLQTTTFIYFGDLGVSTTALGLSVFLSCFTEAVVFFYSKDIWRVLGGAQGAFLTGMALSSLALLMYGGVHLVGSNVTPWFVAVETLNGGTYAMFLTAAVGLVSEMAPPHLATSAQGVLMGLGNGVGPSIGAAVSGALYSSVGAPVVYVGLAVGQLGVMALPLLLRADLSGGLGCENERGHVIVEEAAPLLDKSEQGR